MSLIFSVYLTAINWCVDCALGVELDLISRDLLLYLVIECVLSLTYAIDVCRCTDIMDVEMRSLDYLADLFCVIHPDLWLR